MGSGQPQAPQHHMPALLTSMGLRLTPLRENLPPTGRTQWALANWRAVTTDPWVLSTVEGYSIPFLTTPYQHREPSPPRFSQEEELALHEQLEELQQKGAIKEALDPPCFVSTLFLRPKADNRWRVIFNLKSLNEFVETFHFKMETIRQLGDVLTPHSFMCKVDLSDAYHSIPVCTAHQGFLQFRWKEHLWNYTCLPFGLADAPRAFTKVLAPVVKLLRGHGVILLVYLDDWLIIGASPVEAANAAEAVVALLELLGFRVNRKKSILSPRQALPFLGMDVDATWMTLSLPSDKLQKLRHECRRLHRRGWAKEAELRSILGKMEAASPAIRAARLHVRACSTACKIFPTALSIWTNGHCKIFSGGTRRHLRRTPAQSSVQQSARPSRPMLATGAGGQFAELPKQWEHGATRNCRDISIARSCLPFTWD